MAVCRSSRFRGILKQRRRQSNRLVAGAPYRLQGIAVDDLQSVVAAISQSFAPRELELVQFRGRMFVRAQDGATGRQRLASIGAAATVGLFSRFPYDEVMGAARRAIPSASVTDSSWIDEYDAYYYDRSDTRPLPVFRAKYDDAEEAWLYIVPIAVRSRGRRND